MTAPGVPAPTGAAQVLRPPAHQVAPAAKSWWALGAGLGWLVAVVPVAIGVAFVPGVPVWLKTAGIAVLVGLAVTHVIVMPRYRYAFHRWEINPVAVYAQSGWLTRTRVLIPISRVQVIDTEAGLLERSFGLATVTVTTASSAGTVRISGLPTEVAQHIAASLTVSAAEEADDAT